MIYAMAMIAAFALILFLQGRRSRKGKVRRTNAASTHESIRVFDPEKDPFSERFEIHPGMTCRNISTYLPTSPIIPESSLTASNSK